LKSEESSNSTKAAERYGLEDIVVRFYKEDARSRLVKTGVALDTLDGYVSEESDPARNMPGVRVDSDSTSESDLEADHTVVRKIALDVFQNPADQPSPLEGSLGFTPA